MYFNFSTCFGQLCAHHQENLLYLCDAGIFHSVWVTVWSADQTVTHTETFREVEINILGSSVYLVGFI